MIEINPLTQFRIDMGKQEKWPVLEERLDWAHAVSLEYDLTLAEAAILRHICTRCESSYGVRCGLDLVPGELRMWNEEFIEVYALLKEVGLIRYIHASAMDCGWFYSLICHRPPLMKTTAWLSKR